MRSPLATPRQIKTERKLLTLLQRPEIAAARERAMARIRADAMYATRDGGRLAERAVDGWLARMAFDSFARGGARAEVLWNNQIAAYEWFDHRVPASAAAVDNIDFLYRHMSIDGAAEYEVRGAAQEPAAAIAFQITEEAGGRQGFSMRREGVYDIEPLAGLTDREIQRAEDGSFVVTIGPSPANGRPNHLQTPNRRVHVIVRNILDRWTLNGHDLSVTRLDGQPESGAVDDEAVVLQVADDLEHYVQFWIDYKDQLAGNPPPNQMVGPYVRNGAWSSAAFARTRLAGDEAMVLTLAESGADYVGIQFADVWMISPDPLAHSCSFTRAQSRRNADGSYSYVLCRRDPGVANWIDPADSSEGWLGLRWFGLPAEPGALLRECAVVKLGELGRHFGPDQMIAAAGRAAQIAERKAQWAHRIGAMS